MKRWRGLLDLARDGLSAGTLAFERAQKETAAVPFAVLEALPLIRVPARAVHELHDATVSLAYAVVRVAGQAVLRGIDGTLVATRSPPVIRAR